MPKTNPKNDSDDWDEYVHWKIKKMKKNLKRFRKEQKATACQNTTGTNDPVEALPVSSRRTATEQLPQPDELEPNNSVAESTIQNCTLIMRGTTTQREESVIENENANMQTASNDHSNEHVNPELLDILGVDPNPVDVSYGEDIHKELASRIQHVATSGLTANTRKELCDRYLIPANSVLIGAPQLNAEIKVASTDEVLKRDKIIETRQTQLSAAISGLAVIITKDLEDKSKDNVRLKQLMDVCRILCDIQYSESVTRRDIALFSVKRELKGLLSNTKIDKYLFGESLPKVLKSVEVITRSATELRIQSESKPDFNLKSNGSNPAGLNQEIQEHEIGPLPVPRSFSRHRYVPYH